MLSTTTLELMASGCAIVLLMPGPTNTLLAAAGLKHGLRRSARLTAAELAGYLISITLWGLVLTHTAQSMGWLPRALKIASSVYLLWLAIRLWLTANTIETSATGVIGLRTLFGATLLNPKAILFAGSIFPPEAFTRVAAWLESMALFTALLVPIGFVWIAIGASPNHGGQPRIRPASLQRGASIVVTFFSMSLLWTALR
ncbi:LysE family translocator [Paraburkholderia acidisoli]|uniref:LysE family transporter n=1 Tax=Paraburkholderia acidisoli TaxID=2571748 RepID=A0A7Z2GMN4_9BURK|nr:LysE family transporter [Paraburkholderia acidisoli]QGZ64621.1 LysE family transporter [Paraburkholderia acidisoli]